MSTDQFNDIMDKFEEVILKKVRAEAATEGKMKEVLDRERATWQKDKEAMEQKMKDCEARSAKTLQDERAEWQKKQTAMDQKMKDCEARSAKALEDERAAWQKKEATLDQKVKESEARNGKALEDERAAWQKKDAAMDQKMKECEAQSVKAAEMKLAEVSQQLDQERATWQKEKEDMQAKFAVLASAIEERNAKDAREAELAKRGREVHVKGMSASTKKAVDELSASEAALAKKQANLEQVQKLVADGALDASAEQQPAVQVQAAKDEVARLQNILAEERTEDEVAKDAGDNRVVALQAEMAALRKMLESSPGGAGGAGAPKATGTGRLNTDEDVTDIKYRPIMDFVREITPSMGVEASLRAEVLQVPEFKEGFAAHAEAFIQEVKKIAASIRTWLQAQSLHADLDDEELLAVAIFTAELQSFVGSARPENEFYRIYGNCLRGRQSAKMRLLGNYSYYLFSGIMKMPVAKGILWRGLRGRKVVARVLSKYNAKYLEVCLNAFSSASFDRAVAKSFATQQEDEKLTPEELAEIPADTPYSLILRFEITSCAHDISDISAIPAEREGTVFPGSVFLLMELAHAAGDGLMEVHLAEKPAEKAIQS